MSIDNRNTIDAAGIDKETHAVILSIIDYWDWSDEEAHLRALQDKFNTYFEYIESGQINENYPNSTGEKIRIDLISKHPPSELCISFLKIASRVAAEIDVDITHRLEE